MSKGVCANDEGGRMIATAASAAHRRRRLSRDLGSTAARFKCRRAAPV